MDVPPGPEGQPILPEAVWQTLPPTAQAVVVALAATNTRLEARVRELEAQLGQNSSNSSRPPSSDPPTAPRRPQAPREQSGRTRGGQPGHKAHHRALALPERVDHVVDHWPAACGGCAASLSPVSSRVDAEYVPHQVTEVPPVRAHVTEHRLHRLACPVCGTTTRASLPPEVPRGAFGPRLQGTVAVLTGRYRLSRREVTDVCETLLDVPIALGSVDKLCQVTADALAGPVAAATALLPQMRVGNADETPWRQAGKRGWLWTVVTPAVTVFQVAKSRSSAIIKGLLGEDFTGVLVSDRYSAYSWLPIASRQVCWAHLRRDFQALVDRGGVATPIGTRALTLTRDLFHTWHQFRDGTMDRAGLEQVLAPVQDGFESLLDDGQRSPDPKVASLCRALDRLWPALWTFVDEAGVEPTNNAAERALRPAVLWRKGSFGTQSESGARFVERLLTVIATCKQHGRSVLDYLVAVCTATRLGQPVPPLIPASL